MIVKIKPFKVSNLPKYYTAIWLWYLKLIRHLWQCSVSSCTDTFILPTSSGLWFVVFCWKLLRLSWIALLSTVSILFNNSRMSWKTRTHTFILDLCNKTNVQYWQMRQWMHYTCLKSDSHFHVGFCRTFTPLGLLFSPQIKIQQGTGKDGHKYTLIHSPELSAPGWAETSACSSSAREPSLSPAQWIEPLFHIGRHFAPEPPATYRQTSTSEEEPAGA